MTTLAARLILLIALLGALTTYYLFKLSVVRDGPRFMAVKLPDVPITPFLAEIRAGAEWFYSQPYEDVWIRSDDGLTLAGCYLARPGAQSTIVLVHGYRSKCGVEEFGGVLKSLSDMNLNLLVVDQRAHGRSEGRYIAYGIKERSDVERWTEFLNLRYAPRDIFLLGVSMGSATVLMSTATHLPGNVRGIISDCGYTSPWAIMTSVMGSALPSLVHPLLYPVNQLCRARAGYGLKDCSTLSALRENHIPVLFIHGDDDRFVPAKMSYENYDACAAEKKLVIVHGAGHGCSYFIDPQLVQSEISGFVSAHKTRAHSGVA